jgi:hypothetical protein
VRRRGAHKEEPSQGCPRRTYRISFVSFPVVQMLRASVESWAYEHERAGRQMPEFGCLRSIVVYFDGCFKNKIWGFPKLLQTLLPAVWRERLLKKTMLYGTGTLSTPLKRRVTLSISAKTHTPTPLQNRLSAHKNRTVNPRQQSRNEESVDRSRIDTTIVFCYDFIFLQHDSKAISL